MADLAALLVGVMIGQQKLRKRMWHKIHPVSASLDIQGDFSPLVLEQKSECVLRITCPAELRFRHWRMIEVVKAVDVMNIGGWYQESVRIAVHQ